MAHTRSFIFFCFFFYCSSVQRNSKTNECFINLNMNNSISNKEFIKSSDYNYWEFNCGCFNMISGKYLNGKFQQQYFNKTKKECKSLCLQNYGCYSIQFDINNGACYVFSYNYTTIANKLMINNNFTFWQKNIDCNSNCYFKKSEKQLLINHDKILIKDSNILNCMEVCYKLNEIECSSFNYNKNLGECQLFSKLNNPLFKNFENYDFFEKIC